MGKKARRSSGSSWFLSAVKRAFSAGPGIVPTRTNLPLNHTNPSPKHTIPRACQDSGTAKPCLSDVDDDLEENYEPKRATNDGRWTMRSFRRRSSVQRHHNGHGVKSIDGTQQSTDARDYDYDDDQRIASIGGNRPWEREQEQKLKQKLQQEARRKHSKAMVAVAEAAAEAAVAAAEAAAHVVNLTMSGRNRAAPPSAHDPGHRHRPLNHFQVNHSTDTSQILSSGWSSGPRGSVGQPNASPSAAAAATRIQAAFRGYLARRDYKAALMVRAQMIRQPLASTLTKTNTIRRKIGENRAAYESAASMQAVPRQYSTLRDACVPPYSAHNFNQLISTDRRLMQGGGSISSDAAAARLTSAMSHYANGPALDPLNHQTREWDDRIHTLEELKMREKAKREAAMKRERAMAYALSHQRAVIHHDANDRSQRTAARGSRVVMPGWSWLERWMATRRPWESTRRRGGGSPTRSIASTSAPFIPQYYNNKHTRPHHATINDTSLLSSAPVSPRCGLAPRGSLHFQAAPSSQSYRICNLAVQLPTFNRRTAHSAASSSTTRDHISVNSNFEYGTPGYMAPTKSARAKFRSNNTTKVQGHSTRASSVHSNELLTSNPNTLSMKKLSGVNVADHSSGKNSCNCVVSDPLLRHRHNVL